MNPRLLVPGTSGCKLVRGGQDIGWPTELTAGAWLAGASSLWGDLLKGQLPASVDQLVALLSMEFGDPADPAPVRTTLDGGVMTCGPVLALAYNQFRDYAPFLYDWRSDIRDSAAKLVEHLESRGPGDPKWRILAHAQGALVVVTASKLYAQRHGDDDEAFSSLVSHVALLGAPLHGTVSAAEALLVGDNLAADFKAPFRRIVRTWPALHQMLPTWLGCVRRRRPDGREEVIRTNLLDAAVWEGQGVDPGMLARARITREQFLRAPLSRMRGVAVQIMRSRSYPTRDHVLQTAGGLELAPPGVPGDTLVPDEETYAMGGEVERVRSVTFGGPKGRTLQHFVLANDPAIATAIRDFMG